MKKNIPAIAVLGMLILISLLLRSLPVTFGFPVLTHPDEPLIVDPALKIAVTGDWNPRFFIYPSFYIYLQSFLAITLEAFGMIPNQSPQALWTVLAWGRFITVIFSVLLLMAVYQAGRRLGGSRVGLWAVMFLAFCRLHFENSYIITTDMPSAFFAFLAFWSAWCIYEKGPRLRYYVLTAVALGLAAGTKYPAAVLGVSLLWAHLSQRGAGPGWRNIFNQQFFIFAIGFPLVFLATTPYAVLDFSLFKGFLLLVQEFHGKLSPGAGTGILFYPQALVEKYSAAGLLTALAGVAFLWRQDRRRCIFFLLPIGVIAAVLMLSRSSYDRYLVGMLPFLALLSALGTVWGYEKILSLSSCLWRQMGVVFLTAFLLLGFKTQMAAALEQIRLGSLLDTRWPAKVWLEKHLPPEAKVALEYHTPFLKREDLKISRLGYFGLINPQAALEKFDYAVASSYDYARFFARQDLYFDQARQYQDVFSRYRLIKEFTPDGERYSGPVIKIFEIRK